MYLLDFGDISAFFVTIYVLVVKLSVLDLLFALIFIDFTLDKW